jgi:hypothetical protein
MMKPDTPRDIEQVKWRNFTRARRECTPRRLQSHNLLRSLSVSSSDALGLFPYPSPFAYLVQTGEKTEIENLSAEALHEKFSTFLLSVRKKDGLEYKPTTLG